MSVPMSSKASLPSRSTSAGVCFAFAGKNAHRTFFSGSCEDGIEFGIRHTDNTQIGTEWSNRSILRFSADLRAQKDLWSARGPGKHRQLDGLARAQRHPGPQPDRGGESEMDGGSSRRESLGFW
jgi:hypothetical protein